MESIMQKFGKEFKYIEKEKLVIRYITDDLEYSFDHSENPGKEDYKE